jgi:hypothetical protein
VKPNGLALGPGGLYLSSLSDNFVRRINNPAGDPRLQTLDTVANGGTGHGLNGTMGFIGNTLYLPEDTGATFFDVTAPCAAVGTTTPCNPTPIPLRSTAPGAVPAPVFVAGVTTDPAHGFVYASLSPGGAPANILRYTVATGAVAVSYVNTGVMPAVGAPEATVFCTLSCTRPADPAAMPGTTTGFFFAQGLTVDPANGTLYIAEDATAGARSGRGHVWAVPFVP